MSAYVLFRTNAQGKVGSTAMVTLRKWGVAKSARKQVDSGVAGSAGPAERQVTHRDIALKLFFKDASEAQALVEAAAANIILPFANVASAAGKVTYKNVMFTDPPEFDVPEQDAEGQPVLHCITGYGQWVAGTDTWGTMEVFAAGSP